MKATKRVLFWLLLIFLLLALVWRLFPLNYKGFCCFGSVKLKFAMGSNCLILTDPYSNLIRTRRHLISIFITPSWLWQEISKLPGGIMTCLRASCCPLAPIGGLAPLPTCSTWNESDWPMVNVPDQRFVPFLKCSFLVGYAKKSYGFVKHSIRSYKKNPVLSVCGCLN